MKFVFDRKTLMNEIAIAQKVISTKNALSVLSNVLLVAGDNSLEISATDIKGSFKTRIPVDVEEKGSATVLCDKLMGILSSSPDGDIEFSLTEKDGVVASVKPKAARVKYNLKCIAKDKFPNIPEPKDETFFEVPAKDLKQMVAKTSFSVSTEITRFFMTGVYFEKKDGKLALVATDGRRLSYCERDIAVADFSPVIVPPKILNIVAELSDEGNVSIAVGEKVIFFKVGACEFSEQLVDGQFPRYEKVIPASHAGEFTVQKSDFERAFKRISIMADKSGKVILKAEGGALSISTLNGELGNASEEIPCATSGEGISLAFSCQAISDFLKVALNEELTFEFTDSIHAVVLRQKSDSGFIHILMPMQC